jgi:hypothetical protein
MSETTLPSTTTDLGPGWDDADVRRLERLAALGMGVAEALAGQVTALTAAPSTGDSESTAPIQAARVAQAFTQAARCVRFTLQVKARARGANGLARPRPAEDSDDLNFEIDPDDLDALTHDRLMARAAAEVRMAFEAAINDLADLGDMSNLPNAFAERRRLHVGLERCIEQESERESFRRGPDPDMLHRICEQLGLPWRPTILLDSTRRPQAWVIACPSASEDENEIVWPGRGPYHDKFMEPQWAPDFSALCDPEAAPLAAEPPAPP